eukprot:scaffold536516_cov90-Attheya_sp.AAC.1
MSIETAGTTRDNTPTMNIERYRTCNSCFALAIDYVNDDDGRVKWGWTYYGHGRTGISRHPNDESSDGPSA